MFAPSCLATGQRFGVQISFLSPEKLCPNQVPLISARGQAGNRWNSQKVYVRYIFEGPVDRGTGRMKGTIKNSKQPRTRDQKLDMLWA